MTINNPGDQPYIPPRPARPIRYQTLRDGRQVLFYELSHALHAWICPQCNTWHRFKVGSSFLAPKRDCCKAVLEELAR